MEDAFIIRGGNPLNGEVRISGAKNIALKVLTAALLFEGKSVIENIPRIKDVNELLTLINALGATASFTGANTVTVDPAGLSEKTVDLLQAARIRTSFMFFAPLLHRFNEAHIPNPGGCRLGARSIDRIVDGLKALGAHVDYDSESGYFHAKMDRKPSGTFRFPKVSHTGTELLLMFCALSDSTSVIENAALEPEIDDLIQFLNEAGARIRRENGNVVVEGVATLKQEKPYTIGADRNEAATYAVLALATHGDITLREMHGVDLTAFDEAIRTMGGGIEKIDETSVRYFYQGEVKGMHIETMPHPGFMTDWQPPVAVLMTQAQGESTIHERIFENRFSYVEELHKLGADIEFDSPQIDDPSTYYEFNYEPGKEYQQAIKIKGPQRLHNGVLNIADLRAGATLAIGALIASGESIVRGASHLERGYEDFVGKVRSIGGDIEKV